MKNIIIIICCFVLSLSFSYGQTNSCVNNNIDITSIFVGVDSTSNPESDTTDTPPSGPSGPSGGPSGGPSSPIGPSEIGDRIIYWVHGLSGNVTAWSTASDAVHNGASTFSGRRVSTSRPEYNDGQSLSSAANELQEEIIKSFVANAPTNGTQDSADINFIIAHSQGGLVSRQMDKNIADRNRPEERKYGGIVTFNTPHGGAQILNNIDLLKATLNEGCNVIGEGYVREFLNKLPLVSLILDDDKSVDFISNIGCGLVLGGIVEQFSKKFDTQTSRDFHVGSAIVDTLNSFTHPDIDKVAFHSSVVREPLVWRTLDYFVTQNPNDTLAFTADNDMLLADTMNDFQMELQMKADFWNMAASNLSSLFGVPCTEWFQWVFNTDNCIKYDLAYWQAIDKRNAFQNAVDWMMTINEQYKVGIGAIVPGAVQRKCVCISNGLPLSTSSYPLAPGESCAPSSDNCREVSFVPMIPIDSDGVVLTESQMAFPEAIRYPVGDVTHGQVRNAPETGFVLDLLFEGELYLDGRAKYFKTLKR